MTDRFGDLDHRIVRTKITAETGLGVIDFLAGRFTYHTREEWEKLVTDGIVTVNGERRKNNAPLIADDVIEYHVSELPEPAAELRFSVVYENDRLIAVDKPGNLACHPAGPFYRHTLWFLLKKQRGDIFMVNRIDRETSGLVLIAKTAAAAAYYAKRLPDIRKTYLALVHGIVPAAIDADGWLEPDAASEVRKKRRFVTTPQSPAAQTAHTVIRPLRNVENFTFVEAELHTGRTHQIRATLCSLGHPLVGDKLYGVDDTIYLRTRNDNLTPEDRKKLILPRQALHAAKVVIPEPDGGLLEIEAPPPDFYSFSGKSGIFDANSDM